MKILNFLNFKNRVHIENVEDRDIDFLIKFSYEFFKKECDNNIQNHIDYLNEVADWSVSKKLMLGNEIIGCYILNKRNITDVLPENIDSKWINEKCIYNIEPLLNKRGVEGIALCLDKKYQNLGYGQMMIDSVLKKPDIDYMFTLEYKSIGNIKQWLKRMYLVIDGKNIYLTIEPKKK